MPSTQPLGIGDFVESGMNSSPEGQAGVSKGLRTGQGWGGTELTRGGSLCVKVPEEPGRVATLGSDGGHEGGCWEAGSDRSWELQARWKR